jgi:hypothetical protein
MLVKPACCSKHAAILHCMQEYFENNHASNTIILSIKKQKFLLQCYAIFYLILGGGGQLLIVKIISQVHTTQNMRLQDITIAKSPLHPVTHTC